MSLWNRLFGTAKPAIPSLRQMWGSLAVFSKDDVTSQRTDHTTQVLEGAQKLTVTQRQLHAIEFSIDGYNDDPRDLYEIPEVVSWMQCVYKKHEDLTFWLAPGPLRIVLLCCLPGTWNRRSDGSVETVFEPSKLTEQLQMGNMKAIMSLVVEGVPAEAAKKIAVQAQRNVNDAIHGHAFGRNYSVSFSLPSANGA